MKSPFAHNMFFSNHPFKSRCNKGRHYDNGKERTKRPGAIFRWDEFDPIASHHFASDREGREQQNFKLGSTGVWYRVSGYLI